MRRGRISYSPAELDWVKDNATLSRRDMARLFAARFQRDDVTEENLKALCTRNGWSAGAIGKKRNKGKSLIFSTAQVEWLRQNAVLSRADVLTRFQDVFPGTAITTAQIVAFRKRHGLKTGRTGRFAKGSVPWSKGRKLPYNENSARTQFKVGQRPSNQKPFGHRRVTVDGYIEVKIDIVNPHTGHRGHYVQEHRHLWESKNGPVPEGMCLKCLDGDKTNTDPSNWKSIPIGMLPRLNGRFGRGYDTAPAQLQPTIMAATELEHVAREKRKSR